MSRADPNSIGRRSDVHRAAWRAFGGHGDVADALGELLPDGDARRAAAAWLGDCACLALDAAPRSPAAAGGGAHAELAQLERRVRSALVARLARRATRTAPGLGAAALDALHPLDGPVASTLFGAVARTASGHASVPDAFGGATADDTLRADLLNELGRGCVEGALERARTAVVRSASEQTQRWTHGGNARPARGAAPEDAMPPADGATPAAVALCAVADALHGSFATRIARVEAALVHGAESGAAGETDAEPSGHRNGSVEDALADLARSGRARAEPRAAATLERLRTVHAYVRGDLLAVRAALEGEVFARDGSLALDAVRCTVRAELEAAQVAPIAPLGLRAEAQRVEQDGVDRRRAARFLAAYRAARGAAAPRPGRRRRRRRNRPHFGRTGRGAAR